MSIIKLINNIFIKIVFLFLMFRMSESANYEQYYHSPYIPWKNSWERVYNPKAPFVLYDEYFSTFQSILFLRNMSSELMKDMELKMGYISVTQVEFKDSKHYSAGTVAAGIMEKYSNMLSLYKFYHKRAWLHKKRYWEILYAYEVMQSEYNEYRVEKDLFYDVINDGHKKRNGTVLPGTDQEEKKLTIKTIGDWDKLSDEEKQQFMDAQKAKGWDDENGRRRTSGDQDLKFNSIDEEIKTIRRLENDYKKKMRYNKLSQKLQGFDPEIEGIPINEKLVEAGIKKRGDFKEFNAF